MLIKYSCIWTGCGKTSLMNVLAARVTSLNRSHSKLDGEIYVNGLLRKDDEFRRVSAYVLQVKKQYNAVLLCVSNVFSLLY
jgi:hypothetical protein